MHRCVAFVSNHLPASGNLDRCRGRHIGAVTSGKLDLKGASQAVHERGDLGVYTAFGPADGLRLVVAAGAGVLVDFHMGRVQICQRQLFFMISDNYKSLVAPVNVFTVSLFVSPPRCLQPFGPAPSAERSHCRRQAAMTERSRRGRLVGRVTRRFSLSHGLAPRACFRH